MTNACPLDGVAIAADRTICPGCENAMRGQLRAVPELLDELDTSLARIGTTWRGDIVSAPGTGTCPRVEGADGRLHPCGHEVDSPTCTQGSGLGVNLAASEASMQLRVVLHGWVRVWDEETPIAEGDGTQGPICATGGLCEHPTCLRILTGLQAGPKRRVRDRMLSTTARQAILLAGQNLAGREWVSELARELRPAIRAAEHAIDRPPDLELAGTCTCGMAVYAEAGSQYARCRYCGTTHQAAELYDEMIEARGHVVAAPAALIARTLVNPTTGRPLVTAAQIRGWKHRGRLDVASTNRAGQPCYRIDQVAELARNAEPWRDETEETIDA